MHLAASEGHLEIVKLLLAAGLKNINPIDRKGHSPLNDATTGNYKAICELLKSKGGMTGYSYMKMQKGKKLFQKIILQ